MKNLVSIIITSKNEEKNIGRLLKSIKEQSYKNIEIIVVDNGSTDNTKEISYKYTDLVYDKGPERSAQRNFGAKKARGEYLLFLDADMEITKNVVKSCVEEIENDKKLGELAIAEEPMAKSFWERVKAFERSFYSMEGDVLTDACRFFRKEAFNKVNGYDETITGPEDWDLSERVVGFGYKRGWIKELIKHYEFVPNPLKLAQKKFYYGLKSHRYFKRHNVSKISPKTIYFLRPVFYINWRKIVESPMLSLGMIVMFSFELLGGGLGFVVGKIKNL